MYSNKPQLWVLGDPIEDVWTFGHLNKDKRWINKHTIRRWGGALNTYRNASILAQKLPLITRNYCPDKKPKLIRYMNEETGELIMESWDYFGNLCSMIQIGKSTYHIEEADGLIISEYNKGACNSPTTRKLPKFKFAIVDSRYRTLHLDWLKTSEVKIWHATGKEFDDEWSSNFDYIIHTNGPDNVVIIDDKNHLAEKLTVPPTQAIDTIGAGDTLTAAIGIWLLNLYNSKKYISFQDIVNATRFGIHCCQEVIQEEFTAVPKTTLKEYLNAMDIRNRT